MSNTNPDTNINDYISSSIVNNDSVNDPIHNSIIDSDDDSDYANSINSNLDDLTIPAQDEHFCLHQPAQTVRHGNRLCTIVNNDLHFYDPENKMCIHNGTIEDNIFIEDDDYIRKYHLNKFSEEIRKDKHNTKYIIMIILTGLVFVVELVVGIIIGSLALQSDAFHMLSDVLALSIGLIAKKLSKKGKTDDFTFGYVRAEVIGSLINSIFLLASCFFISLSAIERFFEYEDTDIGNQLLELTIVAAIGLIINIIGIVLFSDHDHHGDHHDHSNTNSSGRNHSDDSGSSDSSDNSSNKDNRKQPNMNDNAVLLHITGDLLGSIGVLATAGIVYFVDSPIALICDPLCSIFIVLILIYGSGKLARQSVNMLLNMVPIEIRADIIYDEILQLNNVVDVHNFHIWSLNQEKAFASLHFITTERRTILGTVDSIKLILHKHKICNSSIQPEIATADNSNDNNRITGCRDINCGINCLDT